MNLIQVFLILGFIGCFTLYAKFFRSLLLDRVIAFLLLFMAIFFVAFPEATVFVAQLLGVGRGTDLVLYIFVILFSFLSLLLYSKLHRLERNQTELARSIALKDARKP